MNNKNYWCYHHVDTNKIKYFNQELHEGRLRQKIGVGINYKTYEILNWMKELGAIDQCSIK